MTHRSLLVILAVTVQLALSGQGLNWNTEAFLKRDRIQPTRDILPTSASLKRYAPHTHYQYGATCVAYSLATARTILHAKARGMTDKDAITATSFSPWFIYYRNRDPEDLNCNLGLDPDKAITDVLNNGVPYMADVEYREYYPFTDRLLTSYYPESYAADVAEAKNYQLDAAYRLESMDDIRLALASGMPVLIGMMPPGSFAKQQERSRWQPGVGEEPDEKNAHAMVVVGYDDSKYGGAIEVLNSYGVGWGMGGYIWISYADVLRFTAGAYALEARGAQRFGQALSTTTADGGALLPQENTPSWKGLGEFTFQAGSPGATQKPFQALQPVLFTK
jgi:hypothetical protein